MFQSDWMKSYRPYKKETARQRIKKDIGIELPSREFYGWIENNTDTIYVHAWNELRTCSLPSNFAPPKIKDMTVDED